MNRGMGEDMRKKEKRKEMGLRETGWAGTRPRKRGTKAGAERVEEKMRKQGSMASP